MSDTQTSFDEKLGEVVERIRRGAYRDEGKDYPALEAGYTRVEAKAAIKQLILDDVIGEDERHDNGVKMVHDPAFCMDCTNPDPRFCRNSFRSEQRLIVKGEK